VLFLKPGLNVLLVSYSQEMSLWNDRRKKVGTLTLILEGKKKKGRKRN
jgi:hypothetical protein